MSDVKTVIGDGTLAGALGSAVTLANPSSVLHVGAHDGEELDTYRDLDFTRIVLVEPDPGPRLRALVSDVRLLEFAVADGEPRFAPWVRAENTHQSHLAGPNDAGARWVRAMPLDHVVNLVGQCDLLVVDTSGTELDVLRSGSLDGFQVVIVETDDVGIHASPTHLVRADMLLKGFRFVERWTHGAHSYGDEVYVRA